MRRSGIKLQLVLRGVVQVHLVAVKAGEEITSLRVRLDTVGHLKDVAAREVNGRIQAASLVACLVGRRAVVAVEFRLRQPVRTEPST